MYVTVSGPRKRRLWVWLLRHRTPRRRRAYWQFRAQAVFKQHIEASLPMVGPDTVALRFAAKETTRHPREPKKRPRSGMKTAKRHHSKASAMWPRVLRRMRMALSPRLRSRATDESLQRALVFMAERAARANIHAPLKIFDRAPDAPPEPGDEVLGTPDDD